MSVIQNNLLMTPEGYQISRSVRLRRSASAYFNRTFGTPTNANIWTLSGWTKRGLLGTQISLFGASVSSYTSVSFLAGDTLRINLGNGTNGSLVTTQVFRDPSAFYHIAIAYDSTQATASNRIKLYINGVQVTAFSTANYPAQNVSAEWNYSGAVGTIGTAATEYFDGYLTEVNFIDGQALTPSSFGETDPITGVWKPKKYAGTYGTNGFYLNFSDNSAATAAAIGKDSSGNGNNWTPNNISVTAGVTYDSMIDVPTMWADGGNGRGNYCVLNPLDVSPTESSGRASISDGNLTVTGGNQFARGWQIPSSGQWYWEITLVDYYNGAPPFIWGQHGISSGLAGNTTGIKLWADTSGGIMQDGAKVQTFSTWANNDVIGFAYDAVTRSMSVYRNGTQLGTSVTANATDKYVYSFLNGTADTSSVAYNFGQRPFAYTPPTGFKALNTQNLPAGSITTSGSFTGNASADGPFVYLNGVPTAMTINGNAVTFATHVDKTANGFKLRTSSSSYNASGSNTYSISTTGAKFKYANAQVNP